MKALEAAFHRFLHGKGILHTALIFMHNNA
jgi:hypothetical protein